jgi:hypothetical protein
MNPIRPVRTLVIVASLLGAAMPVRAHEHSQRTEVLIFASGEARGFDGGDPAIESDDFLATADFLANWTNSRWHALAEFLVTNEEQELERLQIGWEPVPDTFLWVGRFHQPGSFWNTRQHHGQYLQPSVTRPSIENWEDDGGVLPQHVEGLLFETRKPYGTKRGIDFSAGVGISTQLTDSALEPVEVFDPRSRDRVLSYSMQITLLPEFTGDDALGIVASHSEIPFESAPRPDGSDHVDLQIVGVYADISRGPWQITSTIYAVQSEFAGATNAPEDRFLAGYFQLQRHFDSRLTALVRLEVTGGTGDSAYLALFPGFIERRSVFDLRWDFAPRQALSFEFADAHAPNDDYREFRLQWSTALP